MNTNIVSRFFVLVALVFGAIALPMQASAADGTITGSVPAPFIGTWSGLATESSGAQYEMFLNIAGGPERVVVGSASYPSFPCDSEIVLWIAISETEIVAAERLTTGHDVCASGGLVHITHNAADDTLTFEVFAVDYDATVVATLTRVQQ